MRWRWVGAGVAVFMVLAACGSTRKRFRDPELAQGDRRFEYSHQGEVLEATNGLKILLLPDGNTNLVRVDVRYRVGSAEDPKDRSGLAHMVEHMAFQLRPFGADGPSLGEKLGADTLYYNAYTTWDETHYTSTALRDQLQGLLEIEAHRLRANCDQLSDADFAREQEVVRQELQQRSGRGSDLVATLSRAFYGPGHEYSRPVIGTDEHLAAATRDDVCAFFAQHYTPKRAILVVSGAIDVAAVTQLVGPLFGPIPEGAGADRTPVAPAVLSATESWHKLDVEEATAFIAFNARMFTDERAVSELLVRSMLAGWIYSLERDNEFITDTWVGAFGGVRAPLAVVAVSVDDPKRLEEAVDLVFTQRDEFLADFQKPSVGSAVVQATSTSAMINSERADIIASVEPFSARASVFADYLQYSDHSWFVIAALRALTKVDMNKLRGVAPEYYFRSESHVAYVIPDPDSKPRIKRAKLEFSAKDHDLVDWSKPVDETEAQRKLVVPARKRAGAAREFRLDNGMRVVLQPNLAYPVIDARLVFPAGTVHDPDGKPGVAELTAYALRDDYDVELTRDQLEALKSVLRMGGDVRVGVTRRTTTFRIKGLAYFADGLLWQLNWRLESGVYGKKSLDRWKKYSEDDQEDAAKSNRRVRAYLGAVYGAQHPYARASATPKELAAISVGDLAAFRKKFYRANGATLVITGKFDVDDVEQRVRRLFGGWGGGGAPAAVSTPAAAERRAAAHFAYVDKDDPQVTVLFQRALAPGLSERGKRMVFSAMLEERLSSLRVRLGATYGVQVSIVSRDGPGALSISASLDAERAGEALVAMRKEMEDLRGGDTAAFVRARRKALQGVLAQTVDSDSVADELVLTATYGLSSSYFDELAASIAELTPADVSGLIDHALDPDRAVFLIRGPKDFVEATYEAAGITDYETLD